MTRLDPEATRAYDRAKYQRNKDAIKARMRAYYASHREEINARTKAYYNRNRRAILDQQATTRTARRPTPWPTPKPPQSSAPSPTAPARATNTAPTTPTSLVTRTPTLLIAAVGAKPLPGRAPGPPPAPSPSKPVWVPTPINTEITPVRRPTTYLCSCGMGFPTKERANRHERNHSHALPNVRPLGEHREVSVLGL